MRHSAEQKLEMPEPSWTARSAGIQVPQLSQRISLFLDGERCVAAVAGVLSVAALSDSTTLRNNLR